MSKKKKISTSRPPMKQPQAFLLMLAGCVVGGAVVGGIVGVIAALVMRNSLFGLGGLAGALLGMMAGYPIGNIVAMLIMKRWLRQDGSLWLAATLCLVGAAGSLGAAELLNISLAISLPAFFIAAPVLGAVGFRVRRRKK
jgi:hypothetical protein